MSAVTLFELQAGAKTETHQQDIAKLQKWTTVLDFDASCAEVAGNIFQELKNRNSIIEFRDIFIAATAIVHQLEIATLNQNHFARIDEIQLLPL